MQLGINPREKQGAVILDLVGRIVAGPECDALRAQIKELQAGGQKRIVLNMAEISRIDSTGIGMLVEAVINAVKLGGQLKLINLPRLVNNVLITHRLLQAFEIHATEEEALTSFAKASEPAA